MSDSSLIQIRWHSISYKGIMEYVLLRHEGSNWIFEMKAGLGFTVFGLVEEVEEPKEVFIKYILHFPDYALETDIERERGIYKRDFKKDLAALITSGSIRVEDLYV